METSAERPDIRAALAAERLFAIREARSSLLAYNRLMKPAPESPEDARQTSFESTPVAKLLSECLERAVKGEIFRLAVSIPPQHGKSTLISESLPAWILGLLPHANIILGTYNQDFASTWGGKVRSHMLSGVYSQIFPKSKLRRGSKSKELLVTEEGGQAAFIGREGSGTGKPADVFICDDPIKDKLEAASPTILRQVWEWFNAVVFTRCHSTSIIILVHTRWSQDDPIGRLVDPDHPEHDPEIAKLWTYINIPAVITEKNGGLAEALGLPLVKPTDPEIITQFGAAPSTALWPSRKGLRFLAEAKRMDPRIFSALYQGNPTPEDGDYFKREWLVPYKPEELPKNLRKYAASDHALSSKDMDHRDSSVLGAFGLDDEGIIWILPDLYWEKEGDTSVLVEEFILKMQIHRPQIWWAEREHISRSIKPFLLKRMIETGVMSTLVDDSLVSSKDLPTRARPIQGMMSLRRVRFPTFAHWWPEAQAQLLRFPRAAHDDFTSFLSLIGRGLLREMPATKQRPIDGNVVRVGSIQWIKATAARERRAAERMSFARGM